MPLACDIGAERRTADAVERHGKRSRGGRCDDRLESREHALTIGLAERDEPHAGRDETGGEAMQEGRMGQTIRLRNTESNKTVHGRVLGPRLVEVEY